MRSSSPRILQVWLPPILWLGVIAWESFQLSSYVTVWWLYRSFNAIHISLSYAQVESVNHLLRKLGHFTGYGVLTLLFYRAWFYTLNSGGDTARFRLRCATLALLVTLLTAMADEWHQSNDVTRTGTPRDVVLDMAGGITAQLLAFGIYARWRRQKSTQPSSISTQS